MSFEVPVESVGTVERVGGREFQILADAAKKLQEPNAVCVNGTVSRLVLEDIRECAGV